jgi:inosine/xanthosine triphosphatase
VLVRLGSENAAKLEALRLGLGRLFEGVEVIGCAAHSRVPEQPLGLDEVVLGARNRARAAYAVGPCALGAGIEDGLIAVPGTRTGWMNVGCCALFDGDGDHVGLSAGFEYPAACVEAALGPERTPVGTSFDALFRPPAGWPDPGRGAGNIGRLTHGVLPRAEYAAQAVICAAVRLLVPELWKAKG